VVLRESDGVVLHVLENVPGLENKPVSGAVSGQIDWRRRFDHMQHHTGQHILSAAFEKLANADTVGFHLSSDNVTIDLNNPDISPAMLDAAEDLSNQIVADNRPVRAYFPSDEELNTLELRKVPDVEGKFRVVDIAGFDVNACGGTHVTRTGEIGSSNTARQRQATRRGWNSGAVGAPAGLPAKTYSAEPAICRTHDGL
jgi:alanyl-tRNA synthetase